MPFAAFYWHRYRSTMRWFDLFKGRPWGIYLLSDSIDHERLIQQILLAAQYRKKSNANHRAFDVLFMNKYWVLLKILPMKGVMRFEKKENLSLRFIDPFKILKKYHDMAYMLALSEHLSTVHPIFMSSCWIYTIYIMTMWFNRILL